MKELCGTCRFWGPHDKYEDAPGYAVCKRIQHDKDGHTSSVEYDEQHMQELVTEDPDEREKILMGREQKAVSLDGSGYFPAVRSRGDFGCVLHEPIPQEGQKP